MPSRDNLIILINHEPLHFRPSIELYRLTVTGGDSRPPRFTEATEITTGIRVEIDFVLDRYRQADERIIFDLSNGINGTAAFHDEGREPRASYCG